MVFSNPNNESDNCMGIVHFFLPKHGMFSILNNESAHGIGLCTLFTTCMVISKSNCESANGGGLFSTFTT